MAKENTDRTTIDLFEAERRPGRPKTNPLSRETQVRINKRNQVKRDKARGLKRVELKLHESVLLRLDAMAREQKISRAQLIESILQSSLQSVENDAPLAPAEQIN